MPEPEPVEPVKAEVPAVTGKKGVFQKKYSDADRKQAVDDLLGGMLVRDAAEKYDIPQATLYNWRMAAKRTTKRKNSKGTKKATSKKKSPGARPKTKITKPKAPKQSPLEAALADVNAVDKPGRGKKPTKTALVKAGGRWPGAVVMSTCPGSCPEANSLRRMVAKMAIQLERLGAL